MRVVKIATKYIGPDCKWSMCRSIKWDMHVESLPRMYRGRDNDAFCCWGSRGPASALGSKWH